MVQKVSVMVVDDSALMRKMISDMINMEDDMEVIDIARNGEDLLEKLKKQVPDVITLDIEMPKMNGIEALKKVMELKIPTKVIMISSLTQDGAEETMECLENGAIDFVPKPSGSISLNINAVREILVSKIRGIRFVRKTSSISSAKGVDVKEGKIREIHRASQVLKIREIDSMPPKTIRSKEIGNKKISAIVMGASTGGPKALFNVITNLPEKLGVPILVVQHMPEGFTKAFAERLDKFSKVKVVEAREGMSIEKDVVYIAPGGKHMAISRNKTITLNLEPPMWGVRPAVDKLFISGAKVYGENLLGIILTGMGRDGADGIIEVKKAGGATISEDESTCIIYGMPKAAYDTNMIDEVIPLYDISKRIANIVLGDVRN
ncbi:chemotaxis response regulator protein-glutamate methylesterase [Clostridium sp. UBA5119]|uniref:protein-glutamate methylesterase/protein-glutamine glutaminase n=1 Tax=Clostridium sp. UBA5119 TaxID=1946366 RepID=UPI0032173305